MHIKKYGLDLSLLTVADLELVRNWRNAPHVRPYMKYQTLITPEMQQNWFQSLDPAANLYFIIIKDGKKAGVVNLKEINEKHSIAEAGIFIGDTTFINTMIPVLATISIMQLAFEVLELTHLKAQISSTNQKVVVFNESIGYKINAEQVDPMFQQYTVSAGDFYAAIAKLRPTLDKLNTTGSLLELSELELKLFNIDLHKITKSGWKISVSG